MTDSPESPTWDAFISYASEDRATVAQPLAEALTSLGLNIWFDRTELRVGDSLRERVDSGLAESRYGIVILSPAFFGKHYPVRELNGLAQREVEGEKILLPVWYNVSAADVRKFSPPLADRIAANWTQGLDAVVAELFVVIGRRIIEEAQAQAKLIRDLPLITSGSNLIAVLDGAHAHAFINDEFQNTEDVNIVGDFLQTLEDWIEALDEVGAAERSRLAFDLTGSIKRLSESGWKVFGVAVEEPIGRGVPGDWRVACVAIMHNDRRGVARLNGQFLVVKAKKAESIA